MSQKNILKPEQSWLFMILATFLGGFLNTYSFFVRGGAFVSMHTGNMVKMSLAIYDSRVDDFLSALVPIIGCVLGAMIAQIIKFHMKKQLVYRQNLTAIWVEFFALLIVGFIPTTFPHALVTFFLSVTTGYQLSTFRAYEDAPHNTTICTGNLRTLGQHLGDCITNHDLKALFATTRYFFLLFSFTIGALVGSILGNQFGQYSIWLGCLILFCMASLLYLAEKKSVDNSI